MTLPASSPALLWRTIHARWINELETHDWRSISTLGRLEFLLWMFTGAAGFYAAHASVAGSAWVFLGFVALVRFTCIAAPRRAFYAGFSLGLLLVVPQLRFMHTIFGLAAIPLWCVLAFWIGFFVLLGSYFRRSFPLRVLIFVIPITWLGLEYFRSELYYLRFAWLTAGHALGWQLPAGVLNSLGFYGFGCVLMTLAVLVSLLSREVMLACVTGIILILTLALNDPEASGPVRVKSTDKVLNVAAVQLEFPSNQQVIARLDQLILRHPETELLMLSEYTFDGPVPTEVLEWCRKNKKHLVVGAKDMIDGKAFYNTAFVIGPEGSIVFKQVKSVPIQFFADGLPAPSQQLWNSPWGRIGICICYDLSFSRVTDELVSQGAQAILVPTMDPAEWGKFQHDLHARIPTARAMEYGIPIFRVASSGISQIVDGRGRTLVKGSFGEGDEIYGKLVLSKSGTLPMDRTLAPWACGCIPLLLMLARKRSKGLTSRPTISHLTT